jgi:crossover junction endonuclease MUS81
VVHAFYFRCFTTEILERFDVQRTTGYPDTERRYGRLTLSIIDYYSTNFSTGADTSRVCMTYDEFVKRCSELEKVTVSDIFALQLMQVTGQQQLPSPEFRWLVHFMS